MAAPTIATFNPQVQPTTGGSTIVVIGTGFTGATSVQWGTQSVAFTVVADSRITFVAPSGHTGGSYITVTTPQGSVQSSATLSLLSGTNALVSANPTSAAKGATVNLTGTGMTATSHYIYFAPGSNDTTNTISSATAASIVVANRPIGPSQLVYYNSSVGTAEGCLDFTISGTPVQISTLVDNFNSGSISSTLWTNNWPSNFTNVNNQLQCAVAANNVGNLYLYSPNYYDLTNNGASVQLVNAGNQLLTSLNVYPLFLTDVQQYYLLCFDITQGQLLALARIGGVNTPVLAQTLYIPAYHQYFRIREASGTTYWETSPDGVTWNLFYSQADFPAFPYTQLRQFFWFYSNAETVPITVAWDNFNTSLPKLASITNDFSAASYSYPWAQTGSGASTVSNVNGRLQITVPANTASCNGALVTYDFGNSVYLYYDLASSSIVTQVVNAGAQDPNVELWAPQLIDTKGVWYGWHIINGQIQVNNGGSVLKQTPFSLPMFAWLRIREIQGTTYYDYSPDGSNWNNFYSMANLGIVSQVRPNYYLGTNSPGVNAASTVLLDNVNLAPPAAPGLVATAGMSIGGQRMVPVGNLGRIYNLIPNRNYQGVQVSMGASSGMTLAGTDVKLGSVAMASGAGMTVAGAATEVGAVAESATAGMSITAAPMTIQGTVFGPTHMVSGNDADFETGIGSWTVKYYCTIAQSTATAHTGTGSLAATSTSSTSGPAASINFNLYPVIPGQSYKTSFWVSAATTSRNMQLQMNWYNSGGGAISGFSTSVSDPVGSWAQTAVLGPYAAPANAAYIGITWNSFNAQAIGEVHYLDTVVIDQMPGAVTNLIVGAATIPLGGVNLSGTAGMNVAASITQLAGVTLAGGAALNVSGLITRQAAAALSGSTTMTVGAQVTEVASVAMNGQTSMTASTSQVGVAALSATAGLTVAAAVQQNASVVMNGQTTYNIFGTVIRLGTEVLAATAGMTVTMGALIIQGTVFGPVHLLSAADSDFETGLGTWTAVQNCSIAQTTAVANTGTTSLAITSTSASGNPVVRSGYYAVTPGQSYGVNFYVRAATTGRTINMQLVFYDASQVMIGGSGNARATTDPVGSWQNFNFATTAIAPANAAYATVQWNATAGLPVNEVHYLDTVILDWVPGANALLVVRSAVNATAALSATAGLTINPLLTEVAAVTESATAALKITGVGMLFGPNYGQSWSTLTDGVGTWVNPQYADGAPDALYATWTAP